MKHFPRSIGTVVLAAVASAGCTGGPPEEAVDFSAWVTTPVEKVADGFQFTEGPVWHKDGYLLFSDIPANKIYRWTPGETVLVYRANSGKSNGLTLDGEGRLVACEHWNRRISRTELEGALMAVCGLYEGKRFNSPNDLAIRADGMIFFTDPTYGLEDRDKEQTCNGLYRVKPGKEAVLLADDFDMPNGLALSPDENTLYVADTREGHVRAFEIDRDGNVSGGRVLCDVPGPDGMKVDVRGNLYVTSSDGISVFRADGSRLGVIEVPEKPSNCAFGGADMKTLFITARNGLYKVDLIYPGKR
jgi:gluconolactonase